MNTVRRLHRRGHKSPAPEETQAPWWRRRLLFITAMMTTFIAALVAALATAIGGDAGKEVIGRFTDPEKPIGTHVMLDYDAAEAIAFPTPIRSGPDRATLLTSGLSEWDQMIARHNAAPVSAMHVAIQLIGQRRSLVTVTDVRIVLTEPCGPNLSGTYAQIPHAGGRDSVAMTADLDSSRPRLKREDGKSTFPDYNIDLKHREVFTLSLDFKATKRHCSWNLELTYLENSKPDTMKITAPGGRPFSITGRARSYGERYETQPAYPQVGE